MHSLKSSILGCTDINEELKKIDEKANTFLRLVLYSCQRHHTKNTKQLFYSYTRKKMENKMMI